VDPQEAPPHHYSPFDELLGTELVQASGARVVLHLEVTPKLHQPGGIVHGGVYASLVELAASLGGSLALDGRGYAMGVSNHTDFMRSVREGTLRAEATPLQQGRLLQVWQVDVTDEEGRRVAHGKVSLVNRSVPAAGGDVGVGDGGDQPTAS
jgi:1,4-dihydroxy-2-naphthoyl-CoA hydrolase